MQLFRNHKGVMCQYWYYKKVMCKMSNHRRVKWYLSFLLLYFIKTWRSWVTLLYLLLIFYVFVHFINNFSPPKNKFLGLHNFNYKVMNFTFKIGIFWFYQMARFWEFSFWEIYVSILDSNPHGIFARKENIIIDFFRYDLRESGELNKLKIN